MLAGDGWRVGVGGNLGTPALDLLDPDCRARYVLELSSFQLERSAPLPIAAAVVLNVAPDHLDKHGAWRPTRRPRRASMRAVATAVVNRDVPGLAGLVPAGTRAVSFGLDTPGAGHFGIVERPAAEWCERLGFRRRSRCCPSANSA